MTPALYNLLTAILFALPFSPADVKEAGITVRDGVPQAEMRSPGATGWIGCGTTCTVELSDVWNLDPIGRAAVTRHEVCHGIDALSDGKMDGAIFGWQPWVGGAPYSINDPVENLGYWCGGQNMEAGR